MSQNLNIIGIEMWDGLSNSKSQKIAFFGLSDFFTKLGRESEVRGPRPRAKFH